MFLFFPLISAQLFDFYVQLILHKHIDPCMTKGKNISSYFCLLSHIYKENDPKLKYSFIYPKLSVNRRNPSSNFLRGHPTFNRKKL